MCGRFYVPEDDASDVILAILAEAEGRVRASDPAFRLKRGDVCPGDAAAVLALDKRLTRGAFAMRWGFSAQGRLIINARSETALTKPLFRESMTTRRCLIPAGAYFEWDHREKRPVRYRFVPRDGNELYLAGLYRFEPEARQPVFTILTRNAAPEIASIHDRMPVLLPGGLTDAWLSHDAPPEELLTAAITSVRALPA